MPVDADIKDAGALAGFVRWGWPWHGLIAGGTIGTTGHAHTQPAVCDSWLIDRSLPALEITPEEVADYAEMNMEWRNYALIPGGYVYNTGIGADSYLHVDEAGSCWRVALAFSFPSTNTLRITATIIRFGLLVPSDEVPDPPITAEKVVDVACDQIELSNPVATATYGVAYSTRQAKLLDVWTNGSKALVGVLLELSGSDLFSCVEITITGAGGEDGSLLDVAATEIKGQSALTTGAESWTDHLPTDTFSGTVSWDLVDSTYADVCPPEPYDGRQFTMTYELYDPNSALRVNADKIVEFDCVTLARYAFYDSDGFAKAARLRYGETTHLNLTWLTSDWTVTTRVATCTCSYIPDFCNAPSENEWCSERPYNQILTYSNKTVLLLDDAVVDEFGWQTINDKFYPIRSVSGGGVGLCVSGGATVTNTTEPVGSFSAYLPAATEFVYSPANGLGNYFRSLSDYVFTDDAVLITSTTINVGIHKINHNAVAFILNDGTNYIYGNVATPAGILTASLAPDAAVHFALQRKTGDYTFDTHPICYI